MIYQELVTAFLLGLIGGVIPGPVITAIFTEILQSGLRKSLRIVFLALLIETLVAIVSLLLISSLGLPELVFRSLSIAGAGVLIWIAASLWKVSTLDTGEKVCFSLGKITLMILTNGVLWTYWITICIPKAVIVSNYIRYGDFLFMGLVQTGWLISTLALTVLFAQFRSLLSKPAIVPVVVKIFSAVFIYFALDMLVKSILFFVRL
jgi:threonine/homoserine/homoserine lactone efflux protein